MGDEHKCIDGEVCKHTVEDFNPRGHAVKNLQMTVKRAIKLIDLWDDMLTEKRYGGKRKDWTDVAGPKYSDILGEQFIYRQDGAINELFERYKSKELHRQVLDLYNQLPKDMKKGLRNDYNRIRKTVS